MRSRSARSSRRSWRTPCGPHPVRRTPRAPSGRGTRARPAAPGCAWGRSASRRRPSRSPASPSRTARSGDRAARAGAPSGASPGPNPSPARSRAHRPSASRPCRPPGSRSWRDCRQIGAALSRSQEHPSVVTLATWCRRGVERAAPPFGQLCPSPTDPTGKDACMAIAAVEERELLKAMTWWDGFVVALANPGFLIGSLGASISALGTTGAFVLWTISICLGALQNNIHAELAAMFPSKSGGIALYAHEAWRKYFTPIGPLATFGYWIGWSVVLSINGLVAGTLIQSEWFSGSTWDTSGAGFDLTLPICIGIGLIVLVWLFNVYGVRPAVWFAYLTGGLLMIPVLVLMFMPYITGDWSSSNMQWDIGTNGGLPLVIVWLYFMCWSSYGMEVVATFAPEYHDTEKDTTKALRSAALFGIAVYALLPLGLGGTMGTKAVASDPTAIAYFTTAFDKLVGNGLANVMIVCVVAGLVLSMNTATMDGSRALYGIAKDGMTIKQLGTLNRFRVPGRAMTVDAILNILLISYFAGVLEILAVSNIGYVFATCSALAGFLLLRKDRPNWPRPVKLSAMWVPICAVLFAINFVLLIGGGFIWSGGFLGIEGFGYGWDKTRVGLLVLLLAIVLWAWRRIVQDKQPLHLREEVPATPDEERKHPELAVEPVPS